MSYETQTVLDRLPEMLTPEEIRAANARNTDLHTARTFSWNGWDFEAPPGVHLPGKASTSVFERLLDGRIEVTGRSYATIGCGLGVEAVVAGLRGAREVIAADVHAASVSAAAEHYERLVGPRPGTTFRPIVSDLLDSFPDDLRLDVVTFNAPTVAVPVSDDPSMVRILCVGTRIAARFFSQLAERDLLAPSGEVFLLASNTSDLAAIVRHAAAAGFVPEIVHVRSRADIKLHSHLFRFTR